MDVKIIRGAAEILDENRLIRENIMAQNTDKALLFIYIEAYISSSI